jgi:trimeric autotransporter adhesin
MKQYLYLTCTVLCLFSFSLHASGPGDEHWDNQFGPPGINGAANGLVAVVGTNVYAASATVTMAGNTKANGVAGFDGTNWFPLNAGLLNAAAVVCLNSDGNYLYAGGIFTNADDPAAIDAAKWDGTNWSNIGIQGVIEVVKRNGPNLYAGGLFSKAGGVAATNIARWDGTNWFALGTSVSGTGFNTLGSVNCVAFQGNNVYAGGNFSFAGGSSATNVAYWDGSLWHAMGNPFNGPVNGLQFFGTYLYAAGAFTNTALHLTNIARWDGSTWSALPGGGANRVISDLTTNATSLFVGGAFTQIGGIAATGIVSFDGSSTWTTMGGVFGFQGSGGQVNKFDWQGNQLYAGGAFERVGNVGACDVARWDGTNWWSLGTSKGGDAPTVNNATSMLLVNNTTQPGLYIGGLFSTLGNVVLNCIGRWDGTNWNPVGSGMSGSLFGINGQRVLAMATDGTNLYAGGIFTNAGSVYASQIAYWNGSNWNPMGSGVDNNVDAIVVGLTNYIWVGGAFTNAGGTYSRGISEWYAGAWHNLGNVEGTNGTVNALAYDGGTKVYAGGQFYTAGGVNATNIAYFDYNDFSWHAMGLGLLGVFGGRVSSLAYGNGYLYAGGTFTNSSTTALWHIAKWDGTSWTSLGSGITGNSAATVNGISISGANVYVTGNFTNAGGVTATNVAYWDGSAWHGMGSGLDNTRVGGAIAAGGNDVYVAGSFYTAGDKPSVFVAHWNALNNYYPTAKMLLTRASWQTNRQFKFRVTGTSGQSYIIQASTNLTAWTGLQTNSTMFYDFADTNASKSPAQYYRTVLGP